MVGLVPIFINLPIWHSFQLTVVFDLQNKTSADVSPTTGPENYILLATNYIQAKDNWSEQVPNDCLKQKYK